jgi:hypothetical protein
MNNPVDVSLTANVWTLVATNVTTGIIDRKRGVKRDIQQIYKKTGETAPVGVDEGVPWTTSQAFISSTEGIDVYLYAVDTPTTIRISIW